MECIPLNETFTLWLEHYGSIVLFVFLVLGIIALPIPDETLMIFAGYLMNTGKLDVSNTIMAAYLGSICGITVSYILGRTVGHYITHQYGKWFGLTPERLVHVEHWFQKYGKWTLIFGYFIPGIRHFTGVTTGMTYVSYRDFAIFAYTGAVIWASTFLAIGYFFGNYCLEIFSRLAVDIDVLLVIVLAIIFFISLYHFIKNRL